MDERSRRRGTLCFALMALSLAALVPVGYRVFLAAPEGAAALPPAPEPGPGAAASPAGHPDASAQLEDLTVTAVAGSVEIRRGKGAPYLPAALGAALAPEDDLRTGDGRATLTARSAFQVQVEPGTELSVEELNARLSRFGLWAGMLVATVEGGGERSLAVRAAGSDAIAVATEGTFAMSNNGRGTVAVGARSGEVEFRAGGSAVVLRAGQVSVSQGDAPQPPSSVPSSLFLKVQWPREGLVNRRTITVSGRTAPGAVLLVGGAPARVEKDGTFAATLSLREGENRILAEGLDVAGHRVQESSALEVDTTAPESEIRTDDLWRR